MCSMHVSEFSFDCQAFVTTKFMFQAVQSRLLLGDRRGMKSWRNHEEVAKKREEPKSLGRKLAVCM